MDQETMKPWRKLGFLLDWRGWTGRELARRTGKSSPTISRLTARPKPRKGGPGERRPQLETESVIALVMGVDGAWLWSDQPWEAYWRQKRLPYWLDIRHQALFVAGGKPVYPELARMAREEIRRRSSNGSRPE